VNNKPSDSSIPSGDPQGRRGDEAWQGGEGFDPYNRTSSSVSDQSAENNPPTVEEVRVLNSTTAGAPVCADPNKSEAATLAQRVALLSAELERVLMEVGDLGSVASDPDDRRAGELKRQLCRAANYLEEALDCLVPTEPSS